MLRRRGRLLCLLVAATFFAKPSTEAVALGVAPALASWMRAGHRDQVRLEGFLADAEERVQPRLVELASPLSLWLEVGLPPEVPLLDQHDLDNYLFPLNTRLARRHKFVSVWGSKQYAHTSHVRVADVAPLQRSAPDGHPAGADHGI